jgi:TonB-dependent SusC/RagA subfamily outer membrane receptor
MRIRTILCMIVAVISFTGSYGQKDGKKITIKGSVVDGTDASIANAIIMVDGEKTGYVTDREGFYKIKISRKNTKIGVFTFTNGIVEEAINGRTLINFRFTGSVPDQKRDEVDRSEEAINIGYRNVKRKELTFPVGEIDGTKSKYASYNTIYEMIRGEVPGVQVNGTSIMIRGATTINSGTEPLFVVDGVPVLTVDNIQPQMVKSIQVLKGSAASIYGSRGSNGVIIIDLLGAKDK